MHSNADTPTTTRRELQAVIEAICAELGVTESGDERRSRVTTRVLEAYRSGRRHPLNLVFAGFEHG